MIRERKERRLNNTENPVIFRLNSTFFCGVHAGDDVVHGGRDVAGRRELPPVRHLHSTMIDAIYSYQESTRKNANEAM